MNKKKITAHKGGRDKVIVARVSKKEKDIVDKARKEKSYSDYIVDCAKKHTI